VDGLGLVDRRLLARWVAPVVFLLAVTGVVLVVRSGLRNDSTPAVTTTKRPVVGAAHRPAPKPVPVKPKEWYVIQTGDTLGAIAARYGTSVEALLGLNPGIEPTTLRPGQRVRVK
jgi:LysM repeat protein